MIWQTIAAQGGWPGAAMEDQHQVVVRLAALSVAD
jgi:hypothetical protein